ncbi:hypothetical protein CVT26_006414 [Gymnopilus dilepis]|uniref:DUF5648 domain-containing protein n=1 Tax=Gymnopilus dilepis TaxID=231916 RepID=A0A409Y1U2_9AGAR|nr:hypothetical protein CVT26_006414 [Gymnopilus dilepis]
MKFLVHVLAAILVANAPAFCEPVPQINDIAQQVRPRRSRGHKRKGILIERPPIQVRTSQDDCADPTTAQEFIVGFMPNDVYHSYTTRSDFVNEATTIGTNWSLQGPAFHAWKTLPPTVPTANVVAIWELANEAGQNDRVLVAADVGADQPYVYGYLRGIIRGYAYKEQICGSVPLVGVSRPDKTDHYYTTSAFEHDALVKQGWKDENVIVAYVLPA